MAKDEKRPILPRPLYAVAGPVEFSRTDANTGLWYDKFVNKWDVENWPDRTASQVLWSDFFAEISRSGSKSKLRINKFNKDDSGWINTVTGKVGSPKLIAEFAERQRQLAERVGGRSFQFITESRFATGLGREHPIENGFAWHHTLGTPYLPGSSIKGLIRNWAEQWDDKKTEAREILGDLGGVGRVLILDALPVGQPKLEADVMTPHYGDYYQKGEAPGDWLSPTPIPFLVVAAGTPFQFTLVPDTVADKQHLTVVSEWLTEALQWLGAGAKTAIGYGRFQRDIAAEEKLEREADSQKQKEAEAAAKRQAQEARLSGLNPELRVLAQRAETEQWEVSPGAFVPAFQKFLEETSILSSDAIEWIKLHCLEKHWKGIWADPEAKQGKKFKPGQKAIVHRLKNMLRNQDNQ